MEHRPTDERRSQITAALLAVMADHGYEKATIAKIAAAADLTPGLLHYHFRSKQQILLALFDELAAQELASLQRATGDAPHQLAAIVDRLLATGSSARPEHVAAVVMFSAEAIRQPEVAARMRAALDDVAQMVTAVIGTGIREDAWTPVAPTAEIVAAFLALTHGYFMLAATARDLVPRHSAAPAARVLLGAFLDTELP